jgi:hypothetical protein
MFESVVEPNIRANLSQHARSYLAALGLPDPDQDSATAELLWMHALAIGYSPAYLADNADGIRQDWPRIPLPASADVLLASAALGREVAALLDTETELPGVTSGRIHPALQTIAVVSRQGGGPLQPDEFSLTAGWGSGGQGGITMPGRGRSESRAARSVESAVFCDPVSIRKRNGPFSTTFTGTVIRLHWSLRIAITSVCACRARL